MGNLLKLLSPLLIALLGRVGDDPIAQWLAQWAIDLLGRYTIHQVHGNTFHAAPTTAAEVDLPPEPWTPDSLVAFAEKKVAESKAKAPAFGD